MAITKYGIGFIFSLVVLGVFTQLPDNQKKAARQTLVFQDYGKRLKTRHFEAGDPPIEHGEPLVQYGDSIYLKGDWDGSPVVIEEFKLIFFTSAKVGCTTWKHLFRRMMGVSNWKVGDNSMLLPWNPELNNLKYLYDFDRKTASEMMTNPDWTRAIFVRDPKERFLSAYLDKVQHHKTFLRDKCCGYTGNCVKTAKASLEGFLNVIHFCDDSHWRPQSRRMQDKYWKSINYVGRFDTLQQDAERLLKQVGAWERFGQSGWGEDGSESVFQAKMGGTGRQHATNAKKKLQSYLTAELEAKIDEYYADDYANPVLQLEKLNVFEG